MRLVRVLVPEGRREQATTVLDDREVDFVATPSADGDGVVVEFPLPPGSVEEVLGALADAGVDPDRYTVVVDAETARTPGAEEVQAAEESDSIAPEEVRSTAIETLPAHPAYYGMTALSAVVATAGLLLDATALVVGAMVIAPQVGATLSASVGAAFGERDLVARGVGNLVAGLVVAVAAAAAVGAVLRTATVVPPSVDLATVDQIARRVSPGYLSLVVGLAAGAAGAIGLTSALPVTLVGVMVAAALIPAAAAVGVGLAWGHPLVTLGAAVLLVANAIGVTLGGVVVLWLRGYRPGDRAADRGGNASAGTAATALAAVTVLGVAFAGVAAATHDHATFENTANAAVGDVLDREEYAALELVSVRAEFGVREFVDRGQTVTVEVVRPADRDYPGLADALSRALSARTGEPVTVEVMFVERQRADAGRLSAAPAPADAPVGRVPR